MTEPPARPWLKGYAPGIQWDARFPAHPVTRFLDESVERFGEPGTPFDPAIHEAIAPTAEGSTQVTDASGRLMAAATPTTPNAATPVTATVWRGCLGSR